METTKKRFVITAVTAGLAAVINYAISLVLTSYISEVLGTEAYGFVGLAKSVSGYTVLFTTCLNAFAARYITISFHEGQFDKSRVYFSSLYYANVVLSLVLLIASSLFILFLEKIISIPANLVVDVKLLFFLDFINYFILAIGTVYSTYAYIRNRLDIVNTVKMGSYIVEALFLIVLFNTFRPSLIFVGLSICASSVFIFILNRHESIKLLPELTVARANFSFSAVKEFISSGIWNSLNHLGNILNIGLDLIVANLLLSSIAMGQLAIVKTFSTVFATLFQIISTPFQPLLLNAYASDNKPHVVNLFTQSIKLNSMFSNILFAALLAFGIPFLKLWLPNQDTMLLYRLLLITIGGHLIEGVAYPLFYTYTLTLKNKVPCIMTIIGGCLNVIGMVLLIKGFDQGVYSVVITTTVLVWLMHFVFTPLYTARCLKVKWYSFYPMIIRVILSAVFCALVACSIAKLYTPDNWCMLILMIGLSSLAGLFIHLIITSKSKKEVIEMVKIIIRK